MTSRTIPGQQIRGECSLLEKAVLTTNLATPDELAPWKPGGENNPDRGVQGSLRYLCRLHRFHARGEARDPVSGRVAQDTLILEALRDTPIPVHLPSHAVTETPVMVYPKSMDAMMLLHGLDVQLTWMNAQRTELLELTTPQAVDALPRVLDAISYTYQLLVWIVTHPGPEAPFAVQDEAPEPPDWIKKLEPWDFILICDAHQKHLTRLSALSSLLDDKKPAGEKGGRPSWSVFYGSLALDLNTPVHSLLKHRSLVGLMATVRLGNYSKTPPDKES